MNDDLASAWQLHQAGRFADAARRYHVLLQREPDHADALHLFGLLHYQNGYFPRAAALAPEAAPFHANLAEAYRALGRHQEAIDCCQWRAARPMPRAARACQGGHC